MIHGRTLLLGSLALAGTFTVTSTADARGIGSYFKEGRGVPILSPIDSPDCYDSPVGGKVQCVPYYSGYCRDKHPMNYLGAGNNYYNLQPAGAYPTGSYGQYSGARQDEANLLRLGGFGPGNGYVPPERKADLIDMIEGPR